MVEWFFPQTTPEGDFKISKFENEETMMPYFLVDLVSCSLFTSLYLCTGQKNMYNGNEYCTTRDELVSLCSGCLRRCAATVGRVGVQGNVFSG